MCAIRRGNILMLFVLPRRVASVNSTPHLLYHSIVLYDKFASRRTASRRVAKLNTHCDVGHDAPVVIREGIFRCTPPLSLPHRCIAVPTAGARFGVYPYIRNIRSVMKLTTLIFTMTTI